MCPALLSLSQQYRKLGGSRVIAGHIPLRVAKMEDADVIACNDNGDEVSSSLPALCVCVRVGDEGARRSDA